MPRYAQHFLINKNAIQRIVDSINANGETLLMEIGPGKGALTEHLLKTGSPVLAFEVDSLLIQYLTEKFKGVSNLKLIHEDILTAQPDLFFNSKEKKIKIIGNLPYNITSPILRRLCEWPFWTEAIVMVQKEMGDRLVAKSGSKDFGAITVGMNLSCELSSLFDLSPSSFNPPPKVNSSIIRIVRRERPLIENINGAQKIIQAAFQQRRKIILNSLSHGLNKSKEDVADRLKELNIDTNSRPEDIPITTFIELIRNFLS